MEDVSDFRSEEQNPNIPSENLQRDLDPRFEEQDPNMPSKDLSLTESPPFEEQKPNILSENPSLSKDFRFKEQHPNIPSKNPSLSKERWEELKPMISDLCGQGVPISEILRQLELRAIHVTRSQLNTQMKKWGFTKHNVQLLQAARVPPQDLSIKIRDSPQTQIPNSDTDALLIDNQVPIGSGLNDFEASTVEQLECLELEAHFIDQSEATGTSRLLSKDLESLVDETASDTAARVPETSELGRSAPPFPRNTFADETQTSHLQPEVTTHPRLEMPSYESTSTGLEYGSNLWAVGRLSEMADLLSNMKCYTEAFEIFFLIISTLNTVGGVHIGTSCYFLFFAMSCVRSAWTREQKMAAEELVPKLHRWVEAVQQYEDPDTMKYMREVLQVGVQSLEVETLEQTAYWMVGSLLPTTRLAFGLLTYTRIPGPIASPSAAIAYLYSSEIVQYTIRHALVVLERCLWREYTQFKKFLEKALPGSFIGAKSDDLAQLMLRWLSEDPDTSESFSFHLSAHQLRSQVDQHINLTLFRQALVTLTFLVSSRWKLLITDNSTDGPSDESWGFRLLYPAMSDIERALNAGPGSSDYRQVIDEYLRLSSKDTTEQILDASCRRELVHSAAKLAGLGPLTLRASEKFIWRSRQAINAMNADLFPPNSDPDAATRERENSPARDSSPGPTLASSLRSSTSSSFRLFKSTVGRATTSSISEYSMRTTSTGISSDRMSWRFSRVTGISSNSSIESTF